MSKAPPYPRRHTSSGQKPRLAFLEKGQEEQAPAMGKSGSRHKEAGDSI